MNETIVFIYELTQGCEQALIDVHVTECLAPGVIHINNTMIMVKINQKNKKQKGIRFLKHTS